jgi:hypothetical protein
MPNAASSSSRVDMARLPKRPLRGSARARGRGRGQAPASSAGAGGQGRAPASGAGVGLATRGADEIPLGDGKEKQKSC